MKLFQSLIGKVQLYYRWLFLWIKSVSIPHRKGTTFIEIMRKLLTSWVSIPHRKGTTLLIALILVIVLIVSIPHRKGTTTEISLFEYYCNTIVTTLQHFLPKKPVDLRHFLLFKKHVIPRFFAVSRFFLPFSHFYPKGRRTFLSFFLF